MSYKNVPLYQVIINSKRYDGFQNRISHTKRNMIFASAVSALAELSKWEFTSTIKKELKKVNSAMLVALADNGCMFFKDKESFYSCFLVIEKKSITPSKHNFIKFFNNNSTHQSLFIDLDFENIKKSHYNETVDVGEKITENSI